MNEPSEHCLSIHGAPGAHRVCIHQPTYLPWLGFFHKLSISDTWIVLDDCQLTRQSWISRVYVKAAGRRVMLSVPVHYRFAEHAPLRDIRIDDSHNWRRKHAATLRQAYSRCKFFAAIEPLLDITFGRRYTYLLDLDLVATDWLCATLALTPRICSSSSFHLGELNGTERLVALARAAGGTIYVSGRGSDDYLEAAEFEQNSIGLSFQEFVEQPYQQAGAGEFCAGLSAIDAIANVGIDAARALARGYTTVAA